MGEYLLNREFTRQDIDGVIIGAIGVIDAPLTPAEKGWEAFSRIQHGVTEEIRQQARDELLSTSVTDIRSFGEVLTEVTKQNPVVTVLGNKSQLELYNKTSEVQLQIKPLI